jgi:hypothetical protein
MSFIFQWFRAKFNQFVFGKNREDLINDINQRGDIPIRLRDDLIVSLLEDYPQQFFNQLNDTKNNIPEETKEYLMTKAYNIPPLPSVPSVPSVPSMYDGVLGVDHLLSAQDT